jgi:hypothetical protein
VFTKSFEYQSGDLSMLLDGFHKDEDVVKVNADNTFHNEVLKDVIHHGLEGGGGVSECEKHHQGLKQPTICAKCCLPLIAFLHPNIVVAPLNIKLCKVFHTMQLSEMSGRGYQFLIVRVFNAW